MLDFLLGGKCRENKDVEKKLMQFIESSVFSLSTLTSMERMIAKRAIRNPKEYVHAAGHSFGEEKKPNVDIWTKRAFDAYKESLLSYCSKEINNKGPWDEDMMAAIFLSMHGEEKANEYTEKYKAWWVEYQDLAYKFKRKLNNITYSAEVAEKGRVLNLAKE